MTERAAPSPAEVRCFSEDDLLAFANGQLPPELRESAHRHLDVCEECQQLLNEAVRALATARTAFQGDDEEVAWSTTFRPGVLVGRRYEIRRFIARGGMGEVYEAFDQELQERVALKTVTATACDDLSAVRRLKAEVQLARRVSHPNVCRIYDFGTHQGKEGTPPVSFLTMEFVEGETLGVRLRRAGALPVEDAVALAHGLLRGLAAAHAAGVLHRDFKSDNVLLRQDGAQLQPLISDFGLARALDHAAGQSSSSGRGLVGTLAYMAPEQLEGQPYTTASDVYSFGLVWYELLTGELPFKARSSPAVTTLERLTKPVPAPSSKNPLVPAQLDPIVLACLRRSVEDRLQTAPAVLARLEALERGGSESPPKSKTGVALALASLALGVAALILLTGGRSASPVPATVPSQRSRPRLELPATPAAAQSAAIGSHTAAPPPATAGAAPSAAKPKERSRLITSALVTRAKRPDINSGPGWENPFEPRPSAELGAVQNQPLDGRAPAGNSELPERGR
jgi:serine/threonine protein kinase